MGASGALALKLAPSMLLVSNAADAAAAPTRGWRMPPAVVPHAAEPASASPADRAEWSVPDGGVLIVCPYEAAARTRVATLFRALRLVAPRHPGVRAVLTGPGADDEGLRMHASALGVSRLVRCLAATDDPLPVLAAADVGWVVAGGDAGVLDCLAFMTRGIPVIAERAPVTQQCVVDTVTGLLLAPAEPSYHASAVAGMLANAELRATMGRAGQQRALREFPWENMVDALEKAAIAAAAGGTKRT
jgi:glycosyltransferase involved in cell wall biosynthesis